jgi:putative transposase
MTASMSSVGACLDNAVVERFFGSFKHEWLLNVIHLTPINYEKLQSQVSDCA